MANTKINNRYKVRISEQPIFWTINSINHPSQTLWDNTYLPSFIDIDCYINWVDVFTITSVLDKSSYTMLELTDTVTNEVMYFLNSKINKKLSSGYEMEYKVDVYLTFGLKFYQWMVDNKLPIHLNRFLNNDVLKEWFKQSKFINQDPLLNYKKGVVKIDNNTPKISSNATVYSSNFSEGNLSSSGSVTFNGIDSTNGFSNVIWVVVEDNNSNYYAIMVNSNSSNVGTTSLEITGFNNTSINTSSITTTFESVMSIATSDYWISKFVGVFIIPCWWFINNYSIFYDNGNTYFGFTINRSGWLELKTYSQQLYNPTYFYLNSSEFTTEDPNHPNGNTFVDYTNSQYLSDDHHDFANFKLYFNPTSDELIVNNATSDSSKQYIVNSYFFSQLRRNNSVIQYSPINGYWSMFDTSILTFDGNNFNLVNAFKNTINLIDVYNGTMNVATSGYDAYLAGVKTNMNTNLQVAKSQIDLQTQQNNANNIMNSVNGGIGIFNSLMTQNVGGFLSSIMGIVNTNVNTSFDNQKLQLQYTNLQKQQDAQLATARLTSSAKNISSSNAEDDSDIKLLLSWYDTNKSPTNNSLSTVSLAYFISNINDLLFLHNLIYKNGLFCDMFITADVVFNDSTGLNDFIYLDFVCDNDYVRFFSPNMPVDYVDALKIVCSNGLRIWDKVMDITNMPVYYIDFLNQAKQAFIESYVLSDTPIDKTPQTKLDVSLGYPIDDNNDTVGVLASYYSNNQASYVKQAVIDAYPQFNSQLQNIDVNSIQIVNNDYYNSLDDNTKSILDSFDLGTWNDTAISLTTPDNNAGQVFFMINLIQSLFGGDENNRVITNQSMWWIQDNQYLVKVNVAAKSFDFDNTDVLNFSYTTNSTSINFYITINTPTNNYYYVDSNQIIYLPYTDEENEPTYSSQPAGSSFYNSKYSQLFDSKYIYVTFNNYTNDIFPSGIYGNGTLHQPPSDEQVGMTNFINLTKQAKVDIGKQIDEDNSFWVIGGGSDTTNGGKIYITANIKYFN